MPEDKPASLSQSKDAADEEKKEGEEELIAEKKDGEEDKAKEEKSLKELKKTAFEAEKAAAAEIIAKFGVEYGQIKLSKISDYMKDAKDLQDFHAQPILHVVKTISGLCKTLLVRMQVEKA